MPLLRKQPFHRQKIPHDLHPEEEVFHCKITNEIFRDYNVFFERIILCNSLVWSCAITGKSGMTYKEAEECEEKTKKNLANFQDSLKRPLLYLATLTHRGRLNDVNDDVFTFAKDRFFIGETLEYTFENRRKSCKVISVIPTQGGDEKPRPNGDIIVIEDSDEDSNQGTANGKKKKTSNLNPAKYEYKIKVSGLPDPIVVPAVQLSRKRGLYSRERSKLFMKQHCDPYDGLWKVKESILRKLGLATALFGDFFPGPPPVFDVSVIKRKKNAKRPLEPSSYIEFEEPPTCPPNKVMKNNKSQKEDVPLPSQEDRALMREKLKQQKVEEREAKRDEMRRQIEEEKVRRKEERLKEKIKKTEEKRKELELYKEWAKPRDDLECDDLKEMPQFIPVRTRVPPELFGDAVMIVEFTHSFKSIFDFKQFFPKGFTWGMIESALMDHEPDGPLCDLLQMLLCALFNLQEEEAEEYEELEKEENPNKSEDKDKDDDVEEEISTNEMIRSATFMAQYSQNTLGMPLRDTLLDQFTLSEILRIHILSSGARASNKNARFRYQQRGGYTELDDPGLHVKIEHGGVVKALADVNVFDLSPADKVKIIDILIQQIVTYAMVRDMVEESSDKLRLKKYDLKQLQWAEQRREREEQANKYKKMMEEKAKEQAKRMQQLLAEQNGLPADVPPLPDMVDKTTEEKEIEKQKEHEMETRKKSEFSKKETEMVQEILALQKVVSLYPIGRDRMFRRYFYFPTLHGVFIEDNELHVPADMLKPGSAAADTGEKSKLLPQLTFHGNEKEGGSVKPNGDDCIVISDDENGAKAAAKNCTEENGKDVNAAETEIGKNVNTTETGDENTEAVHEDGETKTKSADVALAGVSNNVNSSPVESPPEVKPEVEGQTCPGEESPPVLESEIHSEAPSLAQNPMWSFIDTPEYLDALVASLNTRGFRECSLRTALMEMKPFLSKAMQECPSDTLSLPEDGGEEKARIKALALTRGISSKKAAQDALMCVQEKAEATMELNLRDALLDMEDRIHIGGLGSLKIPNRAAWREALLNRSYESQTDDLNLNSSGKTRVNGTKDTSHYVAQDLGKALVQIARGVEHRFLKDPLRDDETKKKKSKDKKKKDDGDESDGESSTQKKQVLVYERWEESLLGCSSLSQVYLHLASLDKSIVWAKSTLETRCRLCRRKGGAEKMLLCDGCDRGHHMYCLKPPMEKVPKGEWFCPDCRPKQVPRSPSRKGRRKTFTEVEEPEAVEEEELEMTAEESLEEAPEDTTMDDDEEEEEEEVDENEEDITEEEESEEEEEEELEKDDNGDEVCSGCKTGGTLICCDCCPKAFHLHCAKPVLKKIPKGKWMCQVCMGIESTGKIKISVPIKSGKAGRQKGGKTPEVAPQGKGKEKRSSGSHSNSRPNSRPNSRQGSPRDSPVLGKPKKHPISSLAVAVGQPKMKKSKSTPRLSARNANDSESPMIRLMKPINPSSKRSNSQQQQLKAAEEVVNELMKQEESWPFLKPVDKKLVPDYYIVIKQPMDFGTIRNKIHAFSYSKPSEILADVRKIFSNCVEYNNRSSPEYKAYFQLSKFFDRRIREKGLEEETQKSNHGRVSL